MCFIPLQLSDLDVLSESGPLKVFCEKTDAHNTTSEITTKPLDFEAAVLTAQPGAGVLVLHVLILVMYILYMQYTPMDTRACQYDFPQLKFVYNYIYHDSLLNQVLA